jgi:hypothetical protein
VIVRLLAEITNWSLVEIAFDVESVPHHKRFPVVEASKIPTATIVPHAAVATGKLMAAELVILPPEAAPQVTVCLE